MPDYTVDPIETTLVTPHLPLSIPNPFIDVNITSWYFNAIQFVNTHGLMTGTSTSEFSPNIPLTRGMAVTVFYRHAGSPEISQGANVFYDVATGTWYYNAVAWAVANGIANGFGDGNFGPNDYITRQDMVVLLNNFANFTNMQLPANREFSNFNDIADIANYAIDSVIKFYQAIIINGRDGNIFDPTGNATRAEFATLLMNFFRYHHFT